jgi:sugar phosphate isomerase/epimerase
MKYASLGVSSIAWPSSDTPEALSILKQSGCDSVEIAPFNLFHRWDGILDEARTLRDVIAGHGLTCCAIQGILFGVDHVHLFSSEPDRSNLERHLAKVARLAGVLGAKACVLGAPRIRDPGDLTISEAWTIAVNSLRRVAPTFAENQSVLAFEANARHYGCRFINTTFEALMLVREVDTMGVGLQIDTGTLFLENEQPSVLETASTWAVHAHVSEKGLLPPGSSCHQLMATSLKKGGYRGSLSIEMRQVDKWRDALRATTKFVIDTYL